MYSAESIVCTNTTHRSHPTSNHFPLFNENQTYAEWKFLSSVMLSQLPRRRVRYLDWEENSLEC